MEIRFLFGLKKHGGKCFKALFMALVLVGMLDSVAGISVEDNYREPYKYQKTWRLLYVKSKSISE